MKAPLLCKLGFHKWYLDSAIYYGVHRCHRCSAVDDELEAERLALERKIWKEENSKSSDFKTVSIAVAKRLFSKNPE